MARKRRLHHLKMLSTRKRATTVPRDSIWIFPPFPTPASRKTALTIRPSQGTTNQLSVSLQLSKTLAKWSYLENRKCPQANKLAFQISSHINCSASVKLLHSGQLRSPQCLHFQLKSKGAHTKGHRDYVTSFFAQGRAKHRSHKRNQFSSRLQQWPHQDLLQVTFCTSLCLCVALLNYRTVTSWRRDNRISQTMAFNFLPHIGNNPLEKWLNTTSL